MNGPSGEKEHTDLSGYFGAWSCGSHRGYAWLIQIFSDVSEQIRFDRERGAFR